MQSINIFTIIVTQFVLNSLLLAIYLKYLPLVATGLTKEITRWLSGNIKLQPWEARLPPDIQEDSQEEDRQKRPGEDAARHLCRDQGGGRGQGRGPEARHREWQQCRRVRQVRQWKVTIRLWFEKHTLRTFKKSFTAQEKTQVTQVRFPQSRKIRMYFSFEAPTSHYI